MGIYVERSKFLTSKKLNFYKKVFGIVKEEKPKGGEGIKTITIPSSPDQLNHDLVLQLSAAQAGNNNNFNTANALMKEMLKQKIINGKDYRRILKHVYHI